jgi:hypothetical protein
VTAHAGGRRHCSLREVANQKIQEFHQRWKCSKDVEGCKIKEKKDVEDDIKTFFKK